MENEKEREALRIVEREAEREAAKKRRAQEKEATEKLKSAQKEADESEKEVSSFSNTLQLNFLFAFFIIRYFFK